MDYEILRSNIDYNTPISFQSSPPKHSTKPVTDSVSHYRGVNQVNVYMDSQCPYCMFNQSTDLSNCPEYQVFLEF